MKPLDPLNIEMEKSCLIEASAGTGKTYTITTLVMRLLAKGTPVESILVVTFTEAAAAELKLRIRTRLSGTLRRLAADPEQEDDELTAFFRSQKDASNIRRRLALALSCFDQAAVMTIHAFCYKMLKEYSFESRSLFDIELVPDRASFLMQAGYDFFMRHVNELDQLFQSYLASCRVTPESFVDAFKTVLSRSDLRCLPKAGPYIDFYDDYRITTQTIRQILEHEDNAIIQLIRNHKGIDKRSYSKKNVPSWIAAAKQKILLSGDNVLFKMEETGDSAFKFTKSRLLTKTKPGTRIPEHPFFDACERLLSLSAGFQANLIYLKHLFISFLKQEFEIVKQAQGICFFDDLVNDLAAALVSDSGKDLVSGIRQTYKACLIDEFQDTDPTQYDIFSTLFTGGRTPFFMIGDPKQAIYAFRGGDIFAYLKAARNSEQRFTLQKNFRSAPLLVNGVNQIFLQAADPFIYKDIEFSKVSTPETARDRLIQNGDTRPPLQFGLVVRDTLALDRKGFIPKQTVKKLIPELVAADILKLLEGSVRLENKNGDSQPVSPGDIAILVRTNDQAEQIQQSLADSLIPSFLSKTGSVFDSVQAIELNDILHAVVEPGNMAYVRAALCTCVFGWDVQKITVLDEDEKDYYFWQNFFSDCKKRWQTDGFVPMMMSLLHSEEAFLTGDKALNERALTNFYHLVELIAQASLQFRFSAFHLMRWFAKQLSPVFRDQFADELRLESDSQSVAIVTIHKSKGLEYPIVYLPYLWEGERRNDGGDPVFHDPDADDRLTMDLGSEDRNRSTSLARRGGLAEQRRLLYVALTRGAAMCNIIWGGFAGVETSGLANLLHPGGCGQDDIMMADLARLTGEDPKSILCKTITPGPPGILSKEAVPKQDTLTPKHFSRTIVPAWRMSSFTALAQPSATDNLHQPIATIREAADFQEIDLIGFPKGPAAGDFFHKVFENIDFAGSTQQIEEQVSSQAGRFGLTDEHLGMQAVESISRILRTTLETGEAVFCLNQIGLDRRLNEMAFTLPVRNLSISGLQKAMKTPGTIVSDTGYTASLSQLDTGIIDGFLKGFIDLIVHYKGRYYIIDYKSNYLGNTFEAYSPEHLQDAMAAHHYYLQYHIYLLALHLYLSFRLPDYSYDKHVGGVFYLFIRGMRPDFGSRYGVFFDRPSKKTVQDLGLFV